MIKEKAVEVIEQLLKDEEEQGDIFFTNEDKTALKFAIKVLSAPAVEPRIEYGTDGQPYKLSMTNGKEYERPTGDLISREALKDKCNELMKFNPTTDRILNLIDNAPTVDIKDQIAGAYNEGYMCGNKEAEKARPEGEWINHRNDYGHNIADCSLCGKTMQWHDEDEDGVPKYCWYCGAPMKGVKND